VKTHSVSSQYVGGTALSRAGQEETKAGPVGAPSGAGPTLHVRLKPHLPRIIEIIWVLAVLVFSLLCLHGILFAGDPSFEQQAAPLLNALPKGGRVAVSHIYDRTHGDYTELGNLYRDRIENLLRARGIPVAPRRDLGLLVEDMDFYGSSDKAQQVLASAGADTVIWGRYHRDRNPEGKDRIILFLKAVQVPGPSCGPSVLGSVEVRGALDPRWVELASRVFGNHYRDGLEAIGPGEAHATGARKGPVLKVSLNRDPPCYAPGAESRLLIETDPGAHVYILGLQADGTAVLFYPNRLMPDSALLDGRLEFPPAAMRGKVELLLYPLVSGEACREAFKIIASSQPLDVSFLPVPQNQLYAGAKGGDLARVLTALKSASGWSEVTLPYWVSEVCR